MEFLLIGDSKLKIIMSEDDMHRYNLDTGADYGSPSYRRAFWRVLELAGEEVGFSTEGDKLLIQFYPLKSGGCEVFVTKLGILSKESAGLVSDSERVTTLSHKRSFYAFDSLDDLKKFASTLTTTLKPPYPKADIYAGEAGVYYLALEEYTKGGECVEFPRVLEYSQRLTSDLEYYVTEHMTCITEGDGIERLPKIL